VAFDRRDFVKSLTAAVAAPALGAERVAGQGAQAGNAPGPSPKRKRADRPNVILMICDDLGYGDLGSYGSKLPTPNLDRMAAEGTRFTHYNAAHPICSASRAALLTGRYAQRSGTPGALFPNSAGTALDETFLSNLFKARGYKTAAIGKWHLGDLPEYLPSSRGFDSYLGVPYSDDMAPLPLMRETKAIEPAADRTQLTQLYTKEAVRVIEQNADAPFFCYLAFSYPHDPAKASEMFRGKSGFGDYGDSVMEIDWSVGEIMKAVDKAGITGDTLLLFTSDHGPWYLGSAGLLRGRKASTFEGGFRVAFLARCPGSVPARRVAGGWMSALDVMPTLVSFCGLDKPAKPLDGADMSAVLRGTGAEPDPQLRIYFSPIGDGSGVHCVRKGDWKLRVSQGMGGEIYTNDGSTYAKANGWLPRPELYNLSVDIEESYDVASQHADVVKELMDELEKEMKTFPETVQTSYAELKKNAGDVTTPPGASPRPLRKEPLPEWAWEPEDRR
jgi:arylsulfatase A